MESSDAASATSQGEAQPEPREKSRLFAIGKSLLTIHLELAEREANKEIQRLVRGFLCLAVALFFLLSTLCAIQVLGVCLLRNAGFTWVEALALLASAELTCALLLFCLARRALRAPVLPQTRAVLRRTLAALIEPS